MSAMYSFLFDRKSMALLLCGFVVGGGLLFFSGVLVGVYWSLPYGTEIQAGVPPARPAPRRAPEPIPTALPEPPASPTPQAPAAPVPVEPAIELPSAPPPESPGPVADETIGMPKPVPAAPAPVSPPPAPLPRPRRSSRPRPEPAPLPAAVPAGEARYTVQVGAFSQLENSQATVEQLTRRGYEPYVVEVRSSRGGVLRMVRVGRYPDRGAATRAASDLRRKVRMEAIVQRVSPGGPVAEKASATS